MFAITWQGTEFSDIRFQIFVQWLMAATWLTFDWKLKLSENCRTQNQCFCNNYFHICIRWLVPVNWLIGDMPFLERLVEEEEKYPINVHTFLTINFKFLFNVWWSHKGWRHSWLTWSKEVPIFWEMAKLEKGHFEHHIFQFVLREKTWIFLKVQIASRWVGGSAI